MTLNVARHGWTRDADSGTDRFFPACFVLPVYSLIRCEGVFFQMSCTSPSQTKSVRMMALCYVAAVRVRGK